MNTNVPFEILLSIFSHMAAKDKYQCLCVDRKWHQPALTSIYSDVRLLSFRSFRSFLNAVAYSPQNAGRYVKRIALLFKPKQYRCRIVTNKLTLFEFESLARFCPNVQELEFVIDDDDDYYKLLCKVDLTRHWLRLSKLPLIEYSRTVGPRVVRALHQRLKYLILKNAHRMLLVDSFSVMPHLTFLSFRTQTPCMDDMFFTKLHELAPVLRRLALYYEPHSPEVRTYGRKLQSKSTINTLQHLFLHSPMETPLHVFRLVKQSYSRINSILLRWQRAKEITEESRRAVVDTLFDVLESASVQRLVVKCSTMNDKDFIQYFFCGLVNKYIDMYPDMDCTISLELLVFIEREPGLASTMGKDLTSRTEVDRVAGRVHHTLYAGKCFQYNKDITETELVLKNIVDPIRPHVRKLKLDLASWLYFEYPERTFHADPLFFRKPRDLCHFDKILQHLPRLSELYLEFSRTYTKRNNLPDISFCDSKNNQQYPILTCLTIQGATIKKEFCLFLVEHCSNLSSIMLSRCVLRKDVTSTIKEHWKGITVVLNLCTIRKT
ncbi:MAG: hypothetical protein EXX96DRAFT_582990 [Benjaminiella poitrasii]|nr:MAG: hypothetical protein EXX96DRAFT_582990 [Benjaminiella poitrasii]